MDIIKPFRQLPNYSVLRCLECGTQQLIHDSLLPDGTCIECGARLIPPVAAPPGAPPPDALARYAAEMFGENE